MKDKINNALEEEQFRIREEMSKLNIGSEEYLNAAKSMKTISETKSEEEKTKISWKVVAECLLKLGTGIGLIYLTSTHILDDKVERTSDRVVPKLW